jgi:hypothetical protein
LSSAALAYSIVSRWGQLVLAPVWLVLLIPAIRRQPRRFVQALPFAALAGVAILGAQLWLVFSVPLPSGATGYSFAGNFSVQSGQWSPLHLVESRFVNGDGIQVYALPNAAYYGSLLFRWRYLTPILLVPLGLGLWELATRARRPATVFLVAWPAAVLLFNACLTWQNPRFGFTALPPACILAGLGLARLPRWWIFVPVALAAVAVGGWSDTRLLLAQSANQGEVVRFAVHSIPPRSLTLSFGITPALQEFTDLHPYELYDLSPAQLRELLSLAQRPAYVLLSVPAVRGQMSIENPGRDYAWLRHGPGLTRLGRRHGYTLFKVGR